MRALTACGLLAMLAVLTGCGSSSSGGKPASIAISGYAYKPAALTVRPGARITFTNRDSTAHTATSSATPAAFDTGTIRTGQSRTITVAKAGTFTYYCQFHAFMRATVVVK